MNWQLIVCTGLMDVEIVRLVATEFDYISEPLLFLDEFFYDRVQSLLKIIQIIEGFICIVY